MQAWYDIQNSIVGDWNLERGYVNGTVPALVFGQNNLIVNNDRVGRGVDRDDCIV